MFNIWGEEEIDEENSFLNTPFTVFICSTLYPLFFPAVSEWHNLLRCQEDIVPWWLTYMSDTSENCKLNHYCCIRFLFYFLPSTSIIADIAFLFTFFWFWHEFSLKGSNMRSWTRKCLRTCSVTVYFMTLHKILMVLLKASRLTLCLECLIITCIKYILS